MSHHKSLTALQTTKTLSYTDYSIQTLELQTFGGVSPLKAASSPLKMFGLLIENCAEPL